MSKPPMIGTVYYDHVEAMQSEHSPAWSDSREMRTQWRLRLRVADDAVKRIRDWLRFKPIVLVTRETDGRTEPYAMSSLPDVGVAVITRDVNVTPDAVAEALGNLVAEHERAVRAADAALVEGVAAIMREHDVTVQDWINAEAPYR